MNTTAHAEKSAKCGKVRAFLERKGVHLSAKTYFVDAMSAMALGLFSSLLIGTIFCTIGEKLNREIFTTIGTYAKQATGPALGVAIAYALHAPAFVLFSSAVVGLAGNTLGGPLGAFFVVIIAAECGKIVSRETKIDLLVTPAVTIGVGVLLAVLIGPFIDSLMKLLGQWIQNATTLRPFLMGIILSVAMGMILTLPISSAALCVSFNVAGIAAGAATAGCCAQMVGFAVMSFCVNGWNGLVAQGLGTSMLQMGNIVRKPLIWLPPTLAAAVTGPIATVVFGLESVPTCAGMGTCGLVGIFGIFTAMESSAKMWLGIVLVCLVLPGVLSWLFSRILIRLGWIRPEDMKLEL